MKKYISTGKTFDRQSYNLFYYYYYFQARVDLYKANVAKTIDMSFGHLFPF